MKKIYFAKLFVGILLFCLIFIQVGILENIFDLLFRISYLGIFFVAIMPIPLVFASCLKWKLLLEYRDIIVNIISLCKYYTIGFFFNNFLPSSIGGDTARSYLVGAKIGSQSESLAAVVLERLSGLFTLVALAILGFALTPAVHDDLLVAGCILILAGGCIVIGAVIWMPPRLIAPIEGWALKLPVFGRVMALFIKMRTAMQGFWQKPKVVWLTLLYSLGYHALTVLNVYVSAIVLGIDVQFIHLCAVTPIILAIAALPTTPGSLGVWEWAYSILLLPIGAAFEEGLAIALLLRGQLLFASLLGGFLYMLEKRQSPGSDEIRTADE